MFKIEVGKPLEGKKPIPPNSAVFDFSQKEEGFLFIAYDNPTPDEIKQIKYGTVNLGILGIKEITFLLFKFGNLDWIDVPYHVKFSKDYKLRYVDIQDAGYLINTVFLNSKDRVVKVIRTISMPHEMSFTFKVLVEIQRETSIDNFDKNLQEIYQAYPTITLVQLASMCGQLYTINKL
jgi:hypothetical protein